MQQVANFILVLRAWRAEGEGEETAIGCDFLNSPKGCLKNLYAAVESLWEVNALLVQSKR